MRSKSLLLIALLLASCATVRRNGYWQTRRYSIKKHVIKELRAKEKKTDHSLAPRDELELPLPSSPSVDLDLPAFPTPLPSEPLKLLTWQAMDHPVVLLKDVRGIPVVEWGEKAVSPKDADEPTERPFWHYALLSVICLLAGVLLFSLAWSLNSGLVAALSWLALALGVAVLIWGIYKLLV